MEGPACWGRWHRQHVGRRLSVPRRQGGRRSAQGPAEAGRGCSGDAWAAGSDGSLGKVGQPGLALLVGVSESDRSATTRLSQARSEGRTLFGAGASRGQSPPGGVRSDLLLGLLLCLAATVRSQMQGPISLPGEVQGTVRLTGHHTTTLVPKWPGATLLCQVLELGPRAASGAGRSGASCAGGNALTIHQPMSALFSKRKKKGWYWGFIPEYQLPSLQPAIPERREKTGK